MQFIVDILNGLLSSGLGKLDLAGLFIWLTASAVFWLLWKNFSRLAWAVGTYTPPLYFSIVIIFALFYMNYPAYSDHLEAIMVEWGRVVNLREALYPHPDYYPYTGMLYGPMMAYIQALPQLFGLPVVNGSKLPGVLAFAVFVFLFFRQNRTPWGRGCLLFLAPYGYVLFLNKPEPFFLLLVALAIWLATAHQGKKHIAIAIGILGGLAAGFKLHGGVYILTAWLSVNLGRPVFLSSYIKFGLAALLAYLSLFLHPSVSLAGGVKYLLLASKHGLDPIGMMYSAKFMIFLWGATWLCCRKAQLNHLVKVQLAGIVILETILVIISSKPGSGISHLLPLVPVHAYLINRFGTLEGQAADSFNASRSHLLVFAMYILIITASAPGYLKSYSHLKKYRAVNEQINTEAQSFGKKYPDLIMGFSVADNYALLHLRHVFLPARQIAFSAYMDLHAAGVTDASFRDRLNACTLPHILMPKQGQPFSMYNWYHYTRKRLKTGPLLSDETRRVFQERYLPLEEG